MLKPWVKWTLLTIWVIVLLCTASMWNPFTSFQALLKYSVVSVVASAIFGALVILIQWYLLLAIIFPLPPRADSKAPQGFWKKTCPWLFKDPPINPKAPQKLDELIGNAQAKVEIREVIDMIAVPERYAASGADLPKGMLFVGPPGVGKTLFARAIANEVGIPFYVVEGSSLSGLIMGLGVLKLKTLFAKLRKHDKAILFIDEIDSIGSSRQGDKGFGGVADMNMTLNTLLTEMDGFRGSNVIVIGATNNDAALDPALMRAGRMDRKIYFQLPAPEERINIFKYYLTKVKADQELDFAELANLTQNFSPAEVAIVVNEAALIGQRPGGPGRVTMETLKQALDRIQVGSQRTLVGSGIEVGNADNTVRLADVIGIDDVKQDILEIVDFLKHGDELRDIGAKIPKGVMLIGPPGVGKTMLAKAMANEANVPFFGMSASYFVSMFAGEGAARIRALYAQARKSPAAIVFIDEIDAISGTMTEAGNQRTSALNQLLIELDGLSRSNVITVGASNNETNLDPAFMRSGRFDRKCYVGLPDADARKQIFSKYLREIKLASEPNLDSLAQQTTNFSGADIAAAVNEAAIIAVRAGKTHVEESDLEAAVDRVSVTAGHKMNTYGMNLARVPDLEVKLSDLKGMEEAKAEASEVVLLLKNAEKIRATGLKAPKGVLLVGPPGTGKTMLAKAIANEAGVPFYALSGGDFQSMWAGVGANRVRAVYEQARRSGKPAIVFIDEIDALGGKRGIDLGGGAIQDSNKTLNQFLVELDGFGKHKVLTIGATNNADMLDTALLRPGRFDRRIDVPRPNLEGREAIIQHYLKKAKVDPRVSALEIARMTVWKSGADLAAIVNEAGLIAIRNGRDAISQIDLIQAIQRQSFGMSYSRQVLLEELRATALHEAGHTIVAYFKNKRNRIQVVTIVPSGGALGYMWSVDKEERHDEFMNDYMTDIEISLGGLVAERMFFGQNSGGVYGDLNRVASIARSMVTNTGMGEFTFNIEAAYGGRDKQPSPDTAREIELQIKNIV
ncbi:MAG: AAA family ATPase, partial [Candidatus Obscuribacterales bacterium]|nr:AAA family ATPase [Candidatus Obscuribacterales bacterium]